MGDGAPGGGADGAEVLVESGLRLVQLPARQGAERDDGDALDAGVSEVADGLVPAGYASLLDTPMRQATTAKQFSAGFGSTTDSGATLTGVAPAPAAGLAATVTFTSHQQAADSANHSTCTDWDITLFLVPRGSGYVIGAPPPGYHASAQRCA